MSRWGKVFLENLSYQNITRTQQDLELLGGAEILMEIVDIISSIF